MDNTKEFIKMCEKATELRIHPFKAGDFQCDVYGVVSVFTSYTDSHPYIWIPRQDQLQEMVSNLGWSLLSFFKDFVYGSHPEEEYRNSVMQKKFKSMEQLWLVFVMKEKYRKTWTGTNWEVNSAKSKV